MVIRFARGRKHRNGNEQNSAVQEPCALGVAIQKRSRDGKAGELWYDSEAGPTPTALVGA